MTIIPANQSVTFTNDRASNGLFVGMVMFQVINGVPTQITGQPGQINNVYPMENIGITKSYFANFQGMPQAEYLALFQTYTDGTFTTPNGDTVSESFIAKILAPVFVKGLEVLVGCEDQPTQKPVNFSQNSDGILLLSFVDEDGKEVDVTSATALTVSILEADATTILVKALGTGVSLVDGSYNQALVEYDSADFALLPTGQNDIQVSLTLNGTTTVLNVYSALNIEPSAI